MAAPVALFGAFDRHNFGDLLFPHIAAALLPGRELLFAGLAERDLRPLGGHRVQALHRLAREGRLQGAQLLHVGGEVLACTARQAAVMLLQPDEVDATLAYLDRHPEAEADWRQALLGTREPMPYVAARDGLPALARVVFGGVGGVALAALCDADRAAVSRRLQAADAVGVRDAVTLQAVRQAGVDALLMPDPAVTVAALFGDRIRAVAAQPLLAAIRQAFPQGFIAVQLAAEFADDAALDTAADALRAATARTPLGLVFFRAGAAPWHDPPDLPQRMMPRLAAPRALAFGSLDVWQTCALLAASRAYAGSSLHGHIVASAFGVPAVGLQKPDEAPRAGKLAAYVHTWHAPEHAIVCGLHDLAPALDRALALDPRHLHDRARVTAEAYRDAFARLALR